MDRTLPQQSVVGSGPIRIAMIDPSPVVLEAISLFLESQPDVEVVVRAGTGEELLQRLRRMRGKGLVALVAMELQGDQDAYWLIHSLREEFPAVRIAAFGSGVDRLSISRALFVGADGFIDRRANPIQFLDAVRSTHRGEMALAGVPRDWLGPITDAIEAEGPGRSVLTPREQEILTVASQGLTANEIALRIGLASRTVTTHLANIYSKLSVGTRVAAVMKAANMGLIDIDAVRPNLTEADAG